MKQQVLEYLLPALLVLTSTRGPEYPASIECYSYPWQLIAGLVILARSPCWQKGYTFRPDISRQMTSMPGNMPIGFVMHVCMFRIKRRQHNKYRRKTEADKTHAERHLFLVGEDKGVGFLLAQQRTSKCNTRYIWSTSTADTTAAAPLVPGTWYALSSVFICFPPVNFPLQSYWSLSCDHGLHYNCSDEFMWEQQQQHSSTTYILSRRK